MARCSAKQSDETAHPVVMPEWRVPGYGFTDRRQSRRVRHDTLEPHASLQDRRRNPLRAVFERDSYVRRWSETAQLDNQA